MEPIQPKRSDWCELGFDLPCCEKKTLCEEKTTIDNHCSDIDAVRYCERREIKQTFCVPLLNKDYANARERLNIILKGMETK